MSRSAFALSVPFWSLLTAVLSAQHAPPAAKFIPLEGLGNHQHKITAAAPQSQRFFDQGLRLLYGFNHDEAIRAFRAIEDVDPNCAMAQWGIAFALGPNYNLQAEPERDKAAYEAIAKAQRFAHTASAAEQDYIAALAKRYAATPESADRKALDQAYADAMRELAKKYPDDLDAATLSAEALMNLRPWDLWTRDGKPQTGTEEIIATLERVLAKNPDHPGANHYYIHAIEASPFPERGVAAAERLPGLMPAAGHMVHMPAHIWLRLGRYPEAAENNRKAVAADREYIARCQPEGVYPMMYYPHNIHFLWSALCWQGRRADSLAAADELGAMMTDDMVRKMPMIEAFMPTRLFTLVRYGMWDEILATPAPAADFPYAAGMRHYARGLAFLETGRVSDARDEIKELKRVHDTIPPERMAMRHPMTTLLGIALDIAEAKLAAKEGQLGQAAGHLESAIKAQDSLQYDEPPPWYYPVRQSLGVVLLSAGKANEAEAVYREDLKEHPENGWSLFGLAESLKAQNSPEAGAAVERFNKAWEASDIKLKSSEY